MQFTLNFRVWKPELLQLLSVLRPYGVCYYFVTGKGSSLMPANPQGICCRERLRGNTGGKN